MENFLIHSRYHCQPFEKKINYETIRKWLNDIQKFKPNPFFGLSISYTWKMGTEMYDFVLPCTKSYFPNHYTCCQQIWMNLSKYNFWHITIVSYTFFSNRFCHKIWNKFLWYHFLYLWKCRLLKTLGRKLMQN